MHVAVVYSLPSKRLLATRYGETDEDSAVIANKVALGFQARGFEVTLHAITEDHIEAIGDIGADCIFNLIEWCGLDIALSEQAFSYLRTLNIPVTGATEHLFVLTGDKIRMKQELQRYKLPTPNGAIFATGDEAIPDDLHYPVIVKPSLEHCSVGLSYDSVAHTRDELMPIVARQVTTFQQPTLVEEFIDGRELLVYLLEEKSKVRVLAIYEAIFSGTHPLPFQTYEAKWETNHPDYDSLYMDIAKLTSKEQKIVEEVAVCAFKKMGFRGYARFDMRLKDNIPYLLETNANPSVYDADGEVEDINSEVIQGIAFPDYVSKIVESALYHHKRGETV